MTETGSKPWYLEECSGTLTSAYSSGQSGNSDHDIVSDRILRFFSNSTHFGYEQITTDLHHGCTRYHTGTSAAAPLAAAVYALVLEAKYEFRFSLDLFRSSLI